MPLLGIAILGVASFTVPGCQPGGSQHATREITDARLQTANQDTSNWLTHGRTYSEQRFSPLTQINEGNVQRLGLVWNKELGTRRGLEATPIVLDGVLYTTSTWSVVHAIDAHSGETLWTFDPQVPRTHARFICCDVVNRGVALYRGKNFVGTLDGRLIALDAETGDLVWETVTVDQSKPYSITGAPRVVKGMVVIGNGGAEYGVRGYVSAYDAETGVLRWRTYTVPGDPSLGFESEAMEKAAATWQGEWWKAGGGGTAWDAIVYDPELDLVYVGTGNGSPWPRDLRSPGGGDNLYLASILALRADDGTLVWHYQTTPGDNWDYTATQPIILADLEIDNRTRKVLMQAPKNGFFYVLDRESGELISAELFVRVSWTTGIDYETGRPIESPAAYAGKDAVLVSPGPQGSHNWHPMAYNPTTGLVYLPAKEGNRYLYTVNAEWRSNALTWNAGKDHRYDGPLRDELTASPPAVGLLIAWDPIEQREVWRVEHPVRESGGVLTTAGNLVFQGRSDGLFVVYRATDGQRLWEFDAGTGILAPPVTYYLDGTQYITLMVGWGGPMGVINPQGLGPVKIGLGRILTFALDGSAELSVLPYGHTDPPTPAIQMDASPAMVQEGALLYKQLCYMCHGVDAVAGVLPDLRYTTEAVHQQFETIVLDGALEPLGMPSFAGLLTSDQVKEIQAYVLSQAEAASQSH